MNIQTDILISQSRYMRIEYKSNEITEEQINGLNEILENHRKRFYEIASERASLKELTDEKQDENWHKSIAEIFKVMKIDKDPSIYKRFTCEYYPTYQWNRNNYLKIIPMSVQNCRHISNNRPIILGFGVDDCLICNDLVLILNSDYKMIDQGKFMGERMFKIVHN